MSPRRTPRFEFLRTLTCRTIATIALPAAFAAAAGAESIAQLEQRARYWAPVVVQAIEHPHYLEAYPTRFDFDGNWRLDDTLEHIERRAFEIPATAYWWAVERGEVVYLGYGFYFAQHRVGAQISENDFAAVVVAVTAERSRQAPQGRFLALAPHGAEPAVVGVERDAFLLSPQLEEAWHAHVDASLELEIALGTNVADVDFVFDAWGMHPIVYAAAGTHEPRLRDRPEGFEVAFEHDDVADWRSRENWDGLVTGGWGASHFRSRHLDGLVYHYEGVADVLVGTKGGGGRGALPHRHEIAGYELRHLEDAWEHRNEAEGPAALFTQDGVLVGDGQRLPHHRLPWGWADGAGLLVPETMFEGLGLPEPSEKPAISFLEAGESGLLYQQCVEAGSCAGPKP